MSCTGVVFDIMRFAIRDGPGLRTTVFLKGCPLSCWWCHNPESQSREFELLVREDRCIRSGACLEVCDYGAVANGPECTHCGRCVSACPSGAREMIGRQMTAEEVMAEIERDIPFYDESGGGVTFSGGEPLMQPEFLESLLRRCKAEGVHTAVDTCGAASRSVFERINPYVDLYLYDLKLMDPREHRKYTGASNRRMLENLRALAASGAAIMARVPVVPGITDDDGNMREIGSFASSLGIRDVALLPYHKTTEDKYARLGKRYRLAGLEAPPAERMRDLRDKLTALGLNVTIGG
jgi:pyruvate formate lyase activating enzyme